MTPAEPFTIARPLDEEMPLSPDLAGQGLIADEGLLPGEGQAPRPEGPAPGGTPQRHLRLVPERSRRRLRGRFLVYSLVAGMLAVAFGLVALHVLIAEAQFKLDGLQQKASSYQERYEKLRLSVSEDEAPARIIQVATDSGLQQPASVTYLPAPRAVSGSRGHAATSTGPRSHPARSSRSTGSGSSSSDVVPAPDGEGDWPSIKPYLSATP